MINKTSPYTCDMSSRRAAIVVTRRASQEDALDKCKLLNAVVISGFNSSLLSRQYPHAFAGNSSRLNANGSVLVCSRYMQTAMHSGTIRVTIQGWNDDIGQMRPIQYARIIKARGSLARRRLINSGCKRPMNETTTL
ncbi:hypothetical protein VTN31DRAFT_1011 [Thermomyces dupontii]|uniref:uncharacterized protein n=1 Tax=Talaromyces thermophilus TaxID=28565 RepID=UPI003743406C